MGWMNTEFAFHQAKAMHTTGAMLYTINLNRQIVEFITLDRGERNPELLAAQSSDLVERYKPELKGHSLHYLSFNPREGRWEIFVSHPSLPRWAMGDRPQEMPLVPVDGFNEPT